MSLYERIIDIQNLNDAWGRVYKNKPAAGVDGVSCEQFHMGRAEYIKQLEIELKEHRYKVLPVKLTSIYKGEKERVIALYSMRDKVVQQSLAQELNRIFEHFFTSQTCAYRPNRSALRVIDEISEKICSNQFGSFLKIDISKYFDTLSWDILKVQLEKYIDDSDVIKLIRENSCAENLDPLTGELVAKTEGIYQGSGISPILSNIYLMEFDRWMCSVDGVYFVRYSDDMIILTENTDKSTELLQKVIEKLGIVGLRINNEKTELGKIEEGFDFLGYHFDRSGKAIPAKAERGLFDRLENMWLELSNIGIEDKLKKTLEILGGWEQYFRGDREIKSIFEYAAVIYANEGNDLKIRKLSCSRDLYKNMYRDLMVYLSSIWRSTDEIEMELFEYEQYYALPVEGKRNRGTQYVKELAERYRKYVILETQDDAVELMQIYSDMREYDNAEYWQQIVERNKNNPMPEQAFSNMVIMPGKILPVYDHSTAERMLRCFAGREDLYSIESTGGDRNRKIELVTKPLNEDVIRNHLKGSTTVGTYLIRPNGTIRNMVFDVDVSKKVLLKFNRGTDEFKEYLKKALYKAYDIVKVLREMGIQGYVEYSGCRGYHVWIFFTEWIPVRYQTLLMDIVIQRIDTCEDITVECFPGKQKIKPGKPGQPVKIPYGMHCRTGEYSYFIDDAGEIITDINRLVDVFAKSSPDAIKRVVAASAGVNVTREGIDVDSDLDVFGDLSISVREVLKKCNLMRYLCQKAAKTAYLTHFERLSILYVFGHLGDEGQQFVHKVMSLTLNYQYQITEKFIRKLPEKPISCPKLRDQYKNLTAEIGCSCNFRRSKKCYPSPVLHAVSLSNDLQPDVTLPTNRSIPKENEQSVVDEINIHKKAQQLATKILEMKKQKRSLDRNIARIEGELNVLFENDKIDCLEIEMGLLVRKKTEKGFEWVIEI